MSVQEARLVKPEHTRRPLVASSAVAVPGPCMTRSEPSHERLIARYIEGWATADTSKIRSATVPSYRFADPLVGNFSRWFLDRYFEHLRVAFGICTGGSSSAVGFNLAGPMDRPTFDGEYLFWREAPQLGLTGVASLLIGTQGVIAEHVCYDLNLAIDVLRRKKIYPRCVTRR